MSDPYQDAVDAIRLAAEAVSEAAAYLRIVERSEWPDDAALVARVLRRLDNASAVMERDAGLVAKVRERL